MRAHVRVLSIRLMKGSDLSDDEFETTSSSTSEEFSDPEPVFESSSPSSIDCRKPTCLACMSGLLYLWLVSVIVCVERKCLQSTSASTGCSPTSTCDLKRGCVKFFFFSNFCSSWMWRRDEARSDPISVPQPPLVFFLPPSLPLSPSLSRRRPPSASGAFACN